MYCAATAADCPFVAKKISLSKMAANKQCEGTDCPGGCCPYVDWYCCPDGMYCAATAADCPFVAKKISLSKMAAKMDFIVLPLLLTVHMLPRSNSLSRWLQRQSTATLGLCALEDAANGDMEHGCAAQ